MDVSGVSSLLQHGHGVCNSNCLSVTQRGVLILSLHCAVWASWGLASPCLNGQAWQRHSRNSQAWWMLQIPKAGQAGWHALEFNETSFGLELDGQVIPSCSI